MPIQKANTIIISLLGLLYSTIAPAQMQKERPICPSVEKIHQMAPYMKKVTHYTGQTYQVTSSTRFDDNGTLWKLTAELIVAESKETAARYAQERASKVTDSVYPIAKSFFETNDTYCLYYEKGKRNPYVAIMADY